ncbi:hypothetical protein SUGI_0181140 [Cryptomeria japonica]|nr:hypothetical protein SUGI_0181140 [Cryptomeria japonica]
MKDKRDLLVEKMSSLQLTNNSLNLYDSTKSLKWSAPPFEQVASAAMHDNGNLVLLSASLEPIWQSFDYPTDTLLPDQELKWKSNTNLSSGRFELALQEDGILVLYPVERVSVSEDTQGNGQFLHRVTLESDRILAQYVWNLDGHNSSLKPIWKPMNDPCKDVKGQCGRNGICQLNSQNKPDCCPPPQFNFIDNQDHFKGCTREWPSCSANSMSNMLRLNNTD